MKLLLVLGNQLFDPSQFVAKKKDHVVFMREDQELCTHFKYHKHKIIFFLSAMRSYAEELRELGFLVHYEKLGQDSLSFEESLRRFLRKNQVENLCHFEIEDKFFEERMAQLALSKNLPVEIWPSPMFLTSRQEFSLFLGKQRKPFMKTFYQWQRQRLGILVKKGGKDWVPEGGRWSFDEDNRKALPVKIHPPSLPGLDRGLSPGGNSLMEVIALVEREFPSHPGRGDNFWLPTCRKGAQDWLRSFIQERLKHFGPYEDALAPHSDFVYHSVLTPFLNTGLLTPQQVVDQVLDAGHRLKVPLNSLEGFVRQVIGWREFIRGIYQNFSETQEKSNFWGHHRRLSSLWYPPSGESEGRDSSHLTGIPPLDQVLQKSWRYGYAHHIERLMVVGNLHLLLGVEPQESHRWFMEMFVDSSDWVMGPNVYGMALFSDGGIFATKPYICGSNYYRKMGNYPAGPWQDGVDGLYWSFVERHRDFFGRNPRLSMMVRSLEKITAERKQRIFSAAEELRQKLSFEP